MHYNLDMNNDALEKQIIEFWKFSEKKKHNFNFKLFIDTFLPILENKLARHGQLSYEMYLDSISSFYDFDILKLFAYKSKHTNSEWSFENIKDFIFKPRYEHFNAIFKGNQRYINLLNLYHKIKSPIYDNGVLLVDECIHALHNSGFLIDVESLRKEYES